MLNSIFAGISMAASFLEVVTSGPAIIIYVALLLLILTILVISIMVSESKNAEASEQPMILMQAMDPNGNAQKAAARSCLAVRFWVVTTAW